MKISVIGLGKLGLCTAACFAAAGHTVYGYDTSEPLSSALQERRCPIAETGLPELLEKAWDNLTVVGTLSEAIRRTDVTLIIVPTPSLPGGRFSIENVGAVLKEMSATLAAKESFHVVNVVSTVMPGSSDPLFRALVESRTGKVCGNDFGLAYNPEFIALGSVIKNFLNPDLVLIGASDQRTADILTELYTSTCQNAPRIAVMSLLNAEITKLTLNCYVTMKISFANNLAAICERIPGADVDVVTAAIGADSRIGGKCLKGGVGFGGPCFPRDNLAFQAFAEDAGTEACLGKAVVAINDAIPQRIFDKITSICSRPAKVAILGVSYKPDTHVTERSHAVALAASLSAVGYRVALHDPKALKSAEADLGHAVQYCNDPYHCAGGASAIVLMTDWPQYGDLDWEKRESEAIPGAVVIDCWRVARDAIRPSFTYCPIGLGPLRERTRPEAPRIPINLADFLPGAAR